MVGRQPILWHVQKGEVKSDVGAIAGALGLDSAAAADLVSRMPVLLALEPAQYGLSLQAVSATLGVPIGALRCREWFVVGAVLFTLRG